PAHEPVQPAELGDQLMAGREEQVERVPEHHVVAELGGLADLERLDDGLRGERDERGRPHLAVMELQGAGAGAPFTGTNVDHGGGTLAAPAWDAAARHGATAYPARVTRRRRR